MAVQVELV